MAFASVIHINLARTWRGGERQVALLNEELNKLNVTQIIICKKDSALESYCKTHLLQHKSFNSSLIFLWLPLYILWLIKLKGFRNIHCHESRAHTIAVFVKFLFRLRFNLIVHRRVLFPIKSKFLTQFKYSQQRVNTVICISKSVEDVVKKSTTISNTVIIPDGIRLSLYHSSPESENINLRRRYNLSENIKIVGYIAALAKEKDHHTFLKVARSVTKNRKDVHFMIVGDGAMESELKNFCQKQGLDEFVTFTGFIDQPEKIINQIDILLFTSTSEGLGSTILDFFANKKPVVSARNGGSESLIEEGQNGYLCEIGDSSTMSKKIDLLLNDPNLCSTLGSNGYIKVCSEYLMETVAAKTLKVYTRTF